MTKPVQIRNEDAVRDIRELAQLTKEPVTKAVAIAVRDRLSKVRGRRDFEAKMRAVDEIVQRVKRRPKIGPLLTDADLYDEDGLPR
jgi:hypothetical protein